MKQDLYICVTKIYSIRVSLHIVNDEYLLFQNTNDVLRYFLP